MARSRPTENTEDHRRRILDAAEVVLRRHGPGKTTVTDVARELGQTHASVYRYFASKAELVDALVARWLLAVDAPLSAIARGTEGTASDRLRAWVVALCEIKVRKVTGDPEHFATYHAIASEAHAVVAHHIASLVGQVEGMIVAGVAAGEFRAADPARAARAFFHGTFRFHHPALLVAPQAIPTVEDLHATLDLLIAGLTAGTGG